MHTAIHELAHVHAGSCIHAGCTHSHLHTCTHVLTVSEASAGTWAGLDQLGWAHNVAMSLPPGLSLGCGGEHGQTPVPTPRPALQHPAACLLPAHPEYWELPQLRESGACGVTLGLPALVPGRTTCCLSLLLGQPHRGRRRLQDQHPTQAH